MRIWLRIRIRIRNVASRILKRFCLSPSAINGTRYHIFSILSGEPQTSVGDKRRSLWGGGGLGGRGEGKTPELEFLKSLWGLGTEEE
jgi:hypothetical protein